MYFRPFSSGILLGATLAHTAFYLDNKIPTKEGTIFLIGLTILALLIDFAKWRK